MHNLFLQEMLKLVVLISFLKCISSDPIENEGERCFVERTGEFGICVSLNDCEYAKNLLKLKRWKRPQHCGNNLIGTFPIVCCPTTRSELVCQTFHPPKEPCLRLSIAGGEKSLAKEFPHMAALGYGEDRNHIEWLCGGSLISEQFVLTAAHCKRPNLHWVRLGDLDLDSTKDESQPQDFLISEIIIHPEYKRGYQYHDIALIKLERSARFSDFVQPACLHTQFTTPQDLTITGWGKIDILGSLSNHLLKTDIYHVNHTICNSKYSKEKRLPKAILNEVQVCAGHPQGKDTCPGDSGGPLQYKIIKFSPHFRIVGVTSFGNACGFKNSVAVYTRVSSYIGWIEDVVWPKDKFAINRML